MEWIRRALLDRIQGKHIHVEPIEALQKIPSEYSSKSPFQGGRSLNELLFHINWWQNFSLGLINGVIGKYKDGLDWPTGSLEWEELIMKFIKGLEELKEIAKNSDLDAIIVVDEDIFTTIGAEVLGVSQHTSYHLGQIVYTCKALNIW